MSTFLIADAYFGSEKALKYRNRPFKSVEEMDAALIANARAVVSTGGANALVWVGHTFNCTRARMMEIVKAIGYPGRNYILPQSPQARRDANWLQRANGGGWSTIGHARIHGDFPTGYYTSTASDSRQLWILVPRAYPQGLGQSSERTDLANKYCQLYGGYYPEGLPAVPGGGICIGAEALQYKPVAWEQLHVPPEGCPGDPAKMLYRTKLANRRG